jgi:hypothetical protein
MKRTNTRTIRLLLQGLESGLSIESACALAGIHRSTWYEWRNRPELQEQIEAAMVKAEAALLESVRVAGQSDWRAAAWILERRFSSTWAKKSEVQTDGTLEVIVRRQDKVHLPPIPTNPTE